MAPGGFGLFRGAEAQGRQVQRLGEFAYDQGFPGASGGRLGNSASQDIADVGVGESPCFAPQRLAPESPELRQPLCHGIFGAGSQQLQQRYVRGQPGGVAQGLAQGDRPPIGMHALGMSLQKTAGRRVQGDEAAFGQPESQGCRERLRDRADMPGRLETDRVVAGLVTRSGDENRRAVAALREGGREGGARVSGCESGEGAAKGFVSCRAKAIGGHGALGCQSMGSAGDPVASSNRCANRQGWRQGSLRDLSPPTRLG